MESSSFSLFETVLEDGSHLVRATGEIDLATAPALHEALVNAPNGTVVVDLTAVEFMDSSGLNVLLKAHKRMKAEGGALHVCRGLAPPVLRVFEITGLDEVFDLRERDERGPRLPGESAM